MVSKAPYKIVGISGSTRVGSTNTALIRLIGELAPKDRVASVEIVDYRGIPVFDGDDEADFGVPEKVKIIGEKIKEADAVYISTPEYNLSVSSPLKNVLDWISRLEGSPFKGKPVAIASVSAGGSGGLRAQYELRKILLYTQAHVLGLPELSISENYKKFDKFQESKVETTLTDEGTVKNAQTHIDAFVEYIDWVKKASA